MSFEIMVKAGVVQPEQVAELQRWGLPTVGEGDPPPVTSGEYTTPRGGPTAVAPLPAEQRATTLLELQMGLESALQDQSLILTRITDPTLVAQLRETRTQGVLHVREGELEADLPLLFGRSDRGEILIPWSSQALEEARDRGDAWLVQPELVFFCACNVYCHDDRKTFIACTPTPGGT